MICLHTAIAGKHRAGRIVLKGELLSLLSQLVIAVSTVILLQEIPTHHFSSPRQQLAFDGIVNSLVVRTSAEVRLVHSEEKRAWMGDKGGIHEEIVEISRYRESRQCILGNRVSIVLGSVDQVHDGSRV